MPKVKFINLMIMDTFGKNDNRKKLINTMRKNYRNRKISQIISKKLYLNLLNVDDIVSLFNFVLRNS